MGSTLHVFLAAGVSPVCASVIQVYCSLERHRGEHVTSFHLHRDDTGEFLLACSVNSDLLGESLI